MKKSQLKNIIREVLSETLNEGMISVKNKDKIEAMKVIKDMLGWKNKFGPPEVKQVEKWANQLEKIINRMPDTHQEQA